MNAQMTENAKVTKSSNKRPVKDANGIHSSHRSGIRRSSGTGMVDGQDCVRLGTRVHRTATGKRFPEKPGGTPIHRIGWYSTTLDEHTRAAAPR